MLQNGCEISVIITDLTPTHINYHSLLIDLVQGVSQTKIHQLSSIRRSAELCNRIEALLAALTIGLFEGSGSFIDRPIDLRHGLGVVCY